MLSSIAFMEQMERLMPMHHFPIITQSLEPKRSLGPPDSLFFLISGTQETKRLHKCPPRVAVINSGHRMFLAFLLPGTW